MNIQNCRAATIDELLSIAQLHLGPSFTKGRLYAALKRHGVPFYKANMAARRGGGPMYWQVAGFERMLALMTRGGRKTPEAAR